MPDQFSFEVGQAERHRVHFSYDGMSGKFKISVDGSLIDTGRVLFDVKMTRRYQFDVGQAERHAIIIDKTRKVLLAGMRPSTYRVWIDGQLAYVVDEYGMRPVGFQPGPPP